MELSALALAETVNRNMDSLTTTEPGASESERQFAPVTGYVLPLKLERRVECNVSSGLVGVGGLLDTVQHGNNAEVLRSLPDECVDLVVTSPPYDDLRTYGGHSWSFTALAEQLARTIKPGGVIVWVVNDATKDGSETGTSMRQAMGFMGYGLRLHDTMIWEKENPTPQDPDCHRYTPAWEYMFVLSKGKPKVCNYIRERCITAGQRSATTSQRKADGESRVDIISRRARQVTQETKIVSNIWRYPVAGGGNGHPAAFPESLAKDHVASWSNPGDLVLDPFAGSGTTLKAAKELNRHWLGIEINEDYLPIIHGRLAQDVLPLMGGGGADLVRESVGTEPKGHNDKLTDRR